MKCVKITKEGRTLYLEKSEPKIKKGWAKIKIMSSGLCGSDTTKIFSDKKSRLKIKENIWGHEFSGVIEDIKINECFKKGDRVAIQPLIFDQSKEIIKAKSIGKEYDGGFAEYVLVPINNLIKLPKDISFDLGALTEVVAVCIHAKDLGEVKKESKVLIIGDGTIGISMAIVLKELCNNVYLKGKNKENLEVVSKLGIKKFKNNENNLNKYNFIFETVGRKQNSTLSEAISFISPKGKIIVLGVFGADYTNKLILRELFFKEASLIGSNCYEGLKDFKKALKLIKKYPNKFNKIITHKIRLKNFKEALRIIKNRGEGAMIKILFFIEDKGDKLPKR